MRGEHLSRPRHASRTSGSSPHARGTHAVHQIQHSNKGIIPACAGNTISMTRLTIPAWDHPRMRGEHFVATGWNEVGLGSSPHARGTPVTCADVETPSGIIPACAGNTALRNCRPSCGRDHPRMRGEHVKIISHATIHMGSSPHARGTLGKVGGGQRVGGIIPACAGNTGHSRLIVSHAWDHPRMRGEHRGKYHMQKTLPGSSPHARGTQDWAGSFEQDRGIIPACAGNTRLRKHGPRLHGDHPRMRGEHLKLVIRHGVPWGSSPHARGTPVGRFP